MTKHTFKTGVVLNLIAFALLVVGFVTYYWYLSPKESPITEHYGLWTYCSELDNIYVKISVCTSWQNSKMNIPGKKRFIRVLNLFLYKVRVSFVYLNLLFL